VGRRGWRIWRGGQTYSPSVQRPRHAPNESGDAVIIDDFGAPAPVTSYPPFGQPSVSVPALGSLAMLAIMATALLMLGGVWLSHPRRSFQSLA